MESVVVTGAGGSVGRRVVSRLLDTPTVGRIVALDRVAGPQAETDDHDRLTRHTVDLRTADLASLLAGSSSVIHLAEDERRLRRPTSDTVVFERLLRALSESNVTHLVMMSSALVYGAHPDNPVPITESHEPRPNGALMQARLKADMEQMAGEWAADDGNTVTVLRPATALSDDGPSWIGSALRAAMAVRAEQVDPPMQFVHHDDLASAAVVSAVARLDATYNVAADGWIGADALRALRGETEVRLPERLSVVRHRLARRVVDRSLLDGLEPYVRYPWVVANDRLRAEGWEPTRTNDETYAAGTTAPLMASLGPRERQELALGLLGAAGVAASGGALWLRSRINR